MRLRHQPTTWARAASQLAGLRRFDGLLGAAVVDMERQLVLADVRGISSYPTRGRATAFAALARATRKLATDEEHVELLITDEHCFQLLCVSQESALFVYAAFERRWTRLSEARFALTAVWTSLSDNRRIPT